MALIPTSPKVEIAAMLCAVALLIVSSPLRAQGDRVLSDGVQNDPAANSEVQVPNDFFDPDDISTRPWYGLPIDLELHGRIDLTVWHFENKNNMDSRDKNFFNILNPALNIFWTLNDRFQIRTEIEYEGDEGHVELDQLVIRTMLPEIDGSADIGITYVPFGIERFFYSSTTNPLIDRPSPFRRIFPGSYADLGVFVRGDHDFDSGWGVSGEGAFTRALQGPSRDDRSTDYFSKFEPQMSGRVAVHPSSHLEVGVSALLTWFEEGTRHRKLDLVGIDLLLRGNDSYLRAEYIEGSVDRAPALGGDFRRQGWYVELYRKWRLERTWLHALEGVCRFDSVDENSRIRSFRDANRWSFGVNWLPDESFRFKLQYQYNDERHREISNDGYLAQLEYHF